MEIDEGVATCLFLFYWHSTESAAIISRTYHQFSPSFQVTFRNKNLAVVRTSPDLGRGRVMCGTESLRFLVTGWRRSTSLINTKSLVAQIFTSSCPSNFYFKPQGKEEDDLFRSFLEPDGGAFIYKVLSYKCSSDLLSRIRISNGVCDES